MAEQPHTYILTFNAGSSSLKFELFEPASAWRSCARGAVRDIGHGGAVFELECAEAEAPVSPVSAATHREAAELVLDALLGGAGRHDLSSASLAATGHRVVHGADRYSVPALVTPSVLSDLESLVDLAPLHLPSSLAVMDAVGRRLAGVPAVAIFDTAFFRELPDVARRYAVPSRWFDEFGVQRYGFHGIAHADMHERLVRGSSAADHPRRVVTLHLGHGCSVTALRDGRPLETSMGFTPLEGLIMATRPGDIDPGAIVHLQRIGETPEALADALNRDSGLRGLSGTSGDVRELLALEEAGDAHAAFALEAFCYRAHKYLGAYAAVLGGIDAVVFGGGVGENAPAVRSRICQGLAWLGLELDEAANAACAGTKQRISTASSAIDVHVIPVREEEAIARAALACVEAQDANTGRASSPALG
jgi:acetate kinase